MSIGGRSRVFLAVVALVAPGSLLVTSPASAGATATVVDLPSEVRAQPRLIRMIGRTDDGHLVYSRESDPSGRYSGPSTLMLAAGDGSSVPMDASVEAVVGDRLVQPVDTTPTSVTSRLVGESSWSTLGIPDGATYLDYTEDGVLVAAGTAGSQQVQLLPWDGSPAVAVDGAPVGSVWAPSRRLGRGSLSLLWARSSTSSTTALLLVDTASRWAWTVDPDSPDCRISSGELWAVNDGTLVWQSRTASGRLLCTTSIPAPGHELGSTSSRPSVTLPLGSPSYDYRLLPVGDEVLVSSSWLAQPSWGGDTDMPIEAVAPDGSVRRIARWAYGVLPSSDEHIVAVAGDAPGQESVRDIDVSTSSSTEVLPVAPIGAWYGGIAVDGDRVVYTDDSGNLGAVRERTVAFANGTTSASTLLQTDAKGPVAAEAGVTAWDKSGWQGRYSAHLSAQGALTYSTGMNVAQTDDRWVMYSGGMLQDTTTGAFRSPMSRYLPPVLQDGVVYTPGPAVPGGPVDSIIAADAATRQATAIPVPPCAYVSRVQVAGSWMLVSCKDTAGNGAALVVDRTGATPTWRLNAVGRVSLGNGFAVARMPDGALSWTPLAVTQPNWQPLGSAAAPDPIKADYAVAVSRGERPTVAWFSGRSAHVALLPVATSPLPAHPHGVLPPSPPTAHLVAVDQAIRVYWNQPAEGEQVTHYDVDAATGSIYATNRYASASVPGSATADTLTDLSNGAPYDVTVTAWNIAGSTTSHPVSATPLAPPADPTDVGVNVDPITSRATVTWAYTPAPKTEPAAGFSVRTAGGTAFVEGLPPDARSTEFVVEEPWQGTLVVMADGAGQSGVGLGAPVSFPGLDTTRPKAMLRGVPAVLLTHRLTPRLFASDDRRLAARPVDVRWRTASLGQRLGPWVRPSDWQRVSTGDLTVPRMLDGQTACFSLRAHDAAGHVSPWTASRCTTVALDDRIMTRSPGARRISGSRFYRGGATVLGTRRTSLELPGLARNTGWLITSTCPGCGRVSVWVGRTSYGTVNLHSASRQDRRLLRLPGPPQSGTLTLHPLRNHERVVIDGLALLAH